MNAVRRTRAVNLSMGAIVVVAGTVGINGCDVVATLLCPPQACCDRGLVSLEGRKITTLMRRTGDTREARFDEVTPENGGLFGTGLSLYENGQLQSFRFGAFAWCMEMGSSWTMRGLYWDNVIDEPSNADTESLTPDGTPISEGNEWTLNNIRVAIAPNQYPILTGWHVDVYVDGAYIITVYRDRNGGPLFTEDVARSRAQVYLDICQGWTR